MLYDLSDKPQQRPQIEELISRVFPKGSPLTERVSVADEFPLLLAKDNAKRILFIEKDNKVVATASYTLFDLVLSSKAPPLRMAGIGLVCTHPDYQKQGLGFQLQQEIEKRAFQNDGALMSILWSELVQFYSKLNYLIAGTELQWVLDKKDIQILKSRFDAELSKSEASDFRIEKLTQFEDVISLYSGFSRGPIRLSEKLPIYNRLLALPNTYAFKAIDNSNQKVKGYAIMGKGRDLRDTIHELIGLPGTLAPLIQKLLPFCENSLRVHQPYKTPFEPEISHWLGVPKKEGLGFFKVFSGPKLIEWINKNLVLPPGIGLVYTGDNKFSLMNRHISFFESNDFGHLLQIFFGPWEMSELEGLSNEFQILAPKMPGPIPLYFWGFDSV
jgi:GNAT superfamily N-acetyltransferase